MKQRGFSTIILIIIIGFFIVGAMGYFVFTNWQGSATQPLKIAPLSAPTQPSAPQTTVTPPPAIQQTPPPENNSGPTGIVLPSDCKVAGSKGDIDPSSKSSSEPAGYVLGDNEWLVDCGSRNSDARGTLGPVLEQQGWKFCDSQTATGHWFINGIITGIIESAGTSYPFRVTQRSGISCHS